MPAPAPLPPRIFKLKTCVQHHPWGKKGSDSLVGQLATAVPCNGIKLDEDEFYAELWMGTCQGRPSHAIINCKATPLSDLIAKDPSLVGSADFVARFPGLQNGQLPFDLKVSSRQAPDWPQTLSDASMGERMVSGSKDRKTDGRCFELAVSLSPVTVLVGSDKSPSPDNTDGDSIKLDILSLLLGDRDAAAEALKLLQEADGRGKDRLESEILTAISRLSNSEVDSILSTSNPAPGPDIEPYANDKRVQIALHFFDVASMQPGQAMLTKSDEHHRWLAGDAVHCMIRGSANQRTSVPVGGQVSPMPFKRATSTHAADDIPCHCKGFTTVYQPEGAGVSLLRCNLPYEGSVEEMEPLDGPSILVTIRGEGYLICGEGCFRKIETGESWFVGAWSETTFKAGDGGWEFYRVFIEP